MPDHVVEARIGAGAFGEVFRGRHAVLGREVAIKILHAKYSADPDAVARFVTEARAVARLSHPAIVEVFELGALADGRRYCVMELVRGRTLREILAERGRIPLDEAIPILRGIADAVDAAHAAGIAHRDLKPDNVFVLGGGEVKLIDFGLAKLIDDEATAVTRTGSVFGTPLYMSPEQCRGRAVDIATDAYSFGALAYHVLTGAPPFSGDALQLALHHLHDRPDPPSRRRPELPERVDAAILALLEKAPAARPLPVRRAVDAIAGLAPIARPRRRLVGVAAGTVAVTAVAAFLIGSRGGAPATSPARFTVKPFTLRLDGVAQRLDLSLDGSTFYYGDRSGSWALDLATGRVDRSAGDHGIAALPDGRHLFSVHATPLVSVSDPDGRDRRPLFDGYDPVLSRDGARLIANRGQWLVVHDLATGETREAVDISGYGVVKQPAWSPDGTHVIWGSNDRSPPERRLHLSRIADGATRVVPVPMLAGTTLFAPAAYLDDGRIVYCGKDASGTSIRVRSLDDDRGERETVVAPLDRGVSGCSVNSAPGDRVVVTAVWAEPNVATIDLAAPRPEIRLAGGEGEARVTGEMTADASAVRVYTRGTGVNRDIPDGEPVLHELPLGGGTGGRIATCPGERGLARRGGALFHVELGPTRATLRRDDCSIAEEWRLPDGTWSVPACGASLCVTARSRAGHLELWRLDPGASDASELARYPDDSASGAFAPSVAVAPDDARVVVLAGYPGVPHVVTTTTGEVSAIAIGEVAAMGVGWSRDPDHFLLIGIDNEIGYGLWRRGVDGESETVWSSSSTVLARVIGSPDTSIVAVDAVLFRLDFFLLEPEGRR